MDFYLVSSNCRDDGNSDYYAPVMREYHLCFMGYLPGENDGAKRMGQTFKDLPIGTGVVIARKVKGVFNYACMGTLGKELSLDDLKNMGMPDGIVDALYDLQIRKVEDFIDLSDNKQDILKAFADGHYVIQALMKVKAEEYPKEVEQLTNMVMEERQRMENEYMKNLLEKNRNIILHGAPGTGKTFLAWETAKMMGAKGDKVEFVQFHPSYDYTDFVEGLRPCSNTGSAASDITFVRQDGIFKKFCKKAIADPKSSYVFIIDEINRGEISKIFGELFFSIDPGYRGDKHKIKTQYQNLIDSDDKFSEGFYIPNNVYVIGTMNDIDRSVDSMDFAFRRRFTFVEITADRTQESILSSLDTALQEEAKQRMDNLNAFIWNVEDNTGIEGLSPAYHIGAAYFLSVNDCDGFEELWNYHLRGLLREYLRGYDNAEGILAGLKDAYDRGF